MIKVFHARPEYFSESIRYGMGGADKLDVEAYFDRNYVLVAYVDTWDLDEAYQLTNHIQEAWNDVSRGSKVDPVGEANSKARSTSVGDVMVREGYTEAVVVAGMGFDKIDLGNSRIAA